MHPINKYLLNILIVIALAVMATSAIAIEHSGSLKLEKCFIEGVKKQLDCAQLTVPENWHQPTSPQLQLNIIIAKAIAHQAKPDPLFLLMGGPGQAASEMVPSLVRVFHQINRDRDLVFIDQRGTGLSNPFSCDGATTDIYLMLHSDFSADDIAQCLNAFTGDLSQYHTNNAILDFDAVRVALGYESINLYGISYGSRAAMVYMREKPDAIRTVVLDGVVPPQVVIGPMGIEAARAFDILLAQCKLSEPCHSQYPNLSKNYHEIRSKLAKQAIVTTVEHPVSDDQITLKVDSKKFINTLRNQLYSVGRRELLPFVITEFYKANYKPFIGLMSQNEDVQGGMYTGLTFNILCNEDLPRVTPQLLAKERDNHFSGEHTFEVFSEVCKHWPTFDVSADFSKAVKSNLPTMLLSGHLDPVTPPQWGKLAATHLSNHRHYIANNAGHGLITQTCAPSMIAQFIDSIDFDDVDSNCLDEQPVANFLLNKNTSLNIKESN